MFELSQTLYDAKECEARSVRAILNVPKSREHIAVAYDHSPKEPLAPEGLAAVWNCQFGTVPVSYFYCASPITSLLYNEHQPNMLIAGCRSGQLFCWDTRSNSRWPTLNSTISPKSHVNPVVEMHVVREPMGGLSLASYTTDGEMCKWPLGELGEPVDLIKLRTQSCKYNMAVHAVEFLNDYELLIGGDYYELFFDDLRVGYSTETVEDEEKERGKRTEKVRRMRRSFTAHAQPTTCLNVHAARTGPQDFSTLCLSGSVDFAVKLWNVRDLMPGANSGLLASWNNAHRFPIVDVRWSPSHPALFASASSDGVLNFWNLNECSEAPVCTRRSDSAISRIAWSRSGQSISVGDGDGRVTLYSTQQTGLYATDEREWAEMERSLATLREQGARHQSTTSTTAQQQQQEGRLSIATGGGRGSRVFSERLTLSVEL